MGGGGEGVRAVGAVGVWAHIRKRSVGGWRGGGEGGGVGAVGVVRAEKVWAHIGSLFLLLKHLPGRLGWCGRWGRGGLGTHWKPLNTSKTLARPARATKGDQGRWGGGVEAVGAVGAEEVWAHIGSL